MSQAVQRVYRVDSQHWEQLSATISSVTIDPVRDAVCYLFPFLAAWRSQMYPVLGDTDLENSMMPLQARRAILGEIEGLKRAAGIGRSIVVYTHLAHRFETFGGLFSFGNPLLAIPHQHLFRPDHSYFGAEAAADGLDQNVWRFTDDETRFLVARELVCIEGNRAFLRLIVKTALIAAAFFVYALPAGWGLLGLAALFLTYVAIERAHTIAMDRGGVEILTTRFNNRVRAQNAARSAIEKMRQQNLARRQQNGFCRWYISEQGDNRLDFVSPPLSARAADLQINS